MCVVIPDGRDKKVEVRPTLDGSKLRRHFGYVMFRVRDLTGASRIAGRAQGLFYLDRHHLFLKINGGTNDFTDKWNYAPEIAKVIPKYDAIDPQVVSDVPNAPGKPPILAQFLIDKGSLENGKNSFSWSFPNTVSKDEPYETTICPEVVLTYTGLTEAALIIKPFGGGTAEIWDLAGRDGETINIAVANLCDENPLRWQTEHDLLPPDVDFKWYYELIGDRLGLKQNLYSLDLPMPYQVKGQGNGQGANCPPARMGETAFSLDKILEIVS